VAEHESSLEAAIDDSVSEFLWHADKETTNKMVVSAQFIAGSSIYSFEIQGYRCNFVARGLGSKFGSNFKCNVKR
jgi:hypothetical protein